jgi:hypothetical protein
MPMTPHQFRQTAINKALRMLHLEWKERIASQMVESIAIETEAALYQKLFEKKSLPCSFTNRKDIKIYEAHIQSAAASPLQEYAQNNHEFAPALLAKKQRQRNAAFWTKPTEKKRQQEEQQLKKQLKKRFIPGLFRLGMTHKEMTESFPAKLRSPTTSSKSHKNSNTWSP